MSKGRSVIITAGERSRRRAAKEATKEIQTYYSGLRASTPLAGSSTGLQAASVASAREVSQQREVPDPSQFQSESEPQGEEFEDGQSYQDSRNPEAGCAVMEGAYESVAARKQYEGTREVGNEGRVNVRTGVDNEIWQEVRVICRDQGSGTRQEEFNDRESLIPQVSICGVQERIDEQRRKSVEADTTGVINRSSGTKVGQPSEARGDEERGLDKVQDLQRQIQELRDELARAGDSSERKEKEGEKSKWNKKQKKENLIRCFNCNEEGHSARSCQKEKKERTTKPKKPEGWEPRAACVVIGGDQTTGMTNVDRQPTEKICIVPWEGPMVVTADGQPMNRRGKVSLTVTNKNASVEGEALVLKTDMPIVELSAIHMEASSGNKTERKVTAMVRVTVPKRSAVPVNVSIPESGGNDTIMLLRPSKKLLQNSGLSAGHALIDCSKTDTVVHVMNLDHADHVIVEGTSIGHLVPIDQTSNLSPEVGEGRDAAGEVKNRSGKSRESAVFDQCVASTLAAQDRNDLIELLIEFQEVFSDSGDCLDQCTVLEHAIPTGGVAPIKQLPRKRAWREREFIKDEVNKTLKQGVIESAQIPWSSPIVLVKKKDEKWRFCIDYRWLNEVTTKDFYPLPRKDNAMSKLEEAALFSVVDLQSGWPVRVPGNAVWAMISSEHIPTANGYGVGRIEVDRLPGKFKAEDGKIYLRERACVDADVVSKAGIKPDPGHCSAIEMFPGPILNANEKGKRKWVKSFVCLCSFYRKFVPNFAQVVYPLTVMEGKGDFRWQEPERNGFAELGSTDARKKRAPYANLFCQQSVEQFGEKLHDNGKRVPRHCMGCKEVSAIHLGYENCGKSRSSCLMLADYQAAGLRDGVCRCNFHPLQERKLARGRRCPIAFPYTRKGPGEAVAMDQANNDQEWLHLVRKHHAEGGKNNQGGYPLCPKLQEIPDREAGSREEEGADGDNAEARALPDATARQIAKFFVEDVVVRNRFPRELTSDQGKCFTAEVTRAVLALLRLSHRMTVPYHQQANGLVERQNKTLATMLAMYVDESHEDWDEFLGFVTFAYNTAEVVIPADLLAVTGPSQPKLFGAEDLLKAMMELREDVKDRLAMVQQRQKTQYDADITWLQVSTQMHQFIKPQFTLLQSATMRPTRTTEQRHQSTAQQIMLHQATILKLRSTMLPQAIPSLQLSTTPQQKQPTNYATMLLLAVVSLMTGKAQMDWWTNGLVFRILHDSGSLLHHDVYSAELLHHQGSRVL
ncbi:Uncharacterized protein APZ42_023099 [Daphnia magna]|uniref:CCHC-type domain-containing protein n=1 Tax=Daphnia magna TaxID=35525 RepID=A0A164V695_9CRUS|nr:Uncharacterized protein APZ42_023099 [Daphnia magna]